MEHLREEIPELEGMMTELVTADRITRSKPDPEGYILAAKPAWSRSEELCGI